MFLKIVCTAFVLLLFAACANKPVADHARINNEVVAAECVADLPYCDGGYLKWKNNTSIYRMTDCHGNCKDFQADIIVLEDKELVDQIQLIAPKDDKRWDTLHATFKTQTHVK